MNHVIILEISGLSICFEKKTIIDNFSLILNKGEKILFQGKSGSGKSTLLRCIMGFIQHYKGEIKILGEKITPKSIWKLRESIGYVQQEPEMPECKVRDVILMPLKYRANRHLHDNTNDLDVLLERFSLKNEILEKNISEISGGEKQRIAIISAILLKRPLYLLDEVTSALDKENKKAVADYFCTDNEISLIVSSHDHEWTLQVDRVCEISLQ